MHFHATGVPSAVHTSRKSRGRKNYVHSDPLEDLRKKHKKLRNLIQAVRDCLRQPLTTPKYDELIKAEDDFVNQLLLTYAELNEIENGRGVTC